MQTSRFGVLEKPRQPGKYRLIVDLSNPEATTGLSVNCAPQPTQEAIASACARGRGTRLAKFDIESTFRIIPVHPEDRQLLGMQWKGKLFVDTALPFGLRSAPKIFNTVADAMQGIFEQEGLEVLHYLDDFLVIGAPKPVPFTATHNSTLVAQHTPGVEKKGADALSRNDHLSFLAQVVRRGGLAEGGTVALVWGMGGPWRRGPGSGLGKGLKGFPPY